MTVDNLTDMFSFYSELEGTGITTSTDITTGNEILAGVRTEYNTGGIPKIYGSTKYYSVKQYNDEGGANEWYYPYLFKATNLGIIGGDENLNFNAEDEVTISEFLKMLIESAGISESELDKAVTNQSSTISQYSIIAEHWAKKYICYALDKNIIHISDVTGDRTPDTPSLRCDVAYIINRLYVDNINQPNLMVPSNLYKYDDSVSSNKNALWKTGKAFVDQEDIQYCKDDIRQLYLNGIMEGDTNGYVNWSATLKRSEAAKMTVKCRFSLDEGIATVKLINEGEANYIDLSLNGTKTITKANDKNNSGEFYFVAPKTGYYYITNDLDNCTVTVSDMKKRDIQGLEASSGGSRYNLLKGETAYIKVETENSSSSYSFTISSPGDNELVFAPDRSGTFIYSSNPEMIEENHLAESGNMLDNYENLTPGTYTYMAWYHNGTSSPIYADVLFNSNNAQIKINKLGLQVFPYDNPPHWTGIQAYADYLGKTILNELDADICNPSVYYATDLNLPQYYTLSNEESSKWLSDIYYNSYGKLYPVMENYNTPIYAIMEFEVLSGSINLCTVAHKTSSNKNQFLLTNAPYVQDVVVSTQSSNSPTWKGITNAMPYVETDVSYTIGKGISEDAYSMPMTIENTFGTFNLNKWITNLNPQNESSDYHRNVVESSMLAFDYYDGYNWHFNTKRTSMINPPVDYPSEGFTPNEILPFMTMHPGTAISEGYYTGLTKQQISISQGNYSVENVYNILLTNDTDSAWKFNYRTDSTSGVVVGISVNGDEMQYSCSGSFSSNYSRFVGRTVSIPKNTTVNIKVSVVLTTGDPGWINNEFYLSKEY